MSKKVEVKTDSYPAGWYSNLEETKFSHGTQIMGYVATPYGVVIVECRPYTDHPSTNLYFIWRGIQTRKYINRTYTRRYLITLAGRFAAEIAESDN
jgi:hypothetical protein